MDIDIRFSKVMAVKNWKWLMFHTRGFRDSDVGRRRKRTDWQCPPLGK